MENTIKEISRLNNEPQCITDYKLSKWKEYNHSPNPDKVTHIWKYSDPKWFELNGFTISEKQADSRLTIPEEYSNKGIIFCTIKEIFRIQPLKEIIKNKFGQLIKDNQNKLNLLNEATWHGGYFLFVPKGIKTDLPFNIKTNFQDGEKLESVRNLIILEDEANINLVEELSSHLTKKILLNIVTEVYLQKGSNLSLSTLQTLGNETTCYEFQKAILNEDAEFTNLIVALGGKIIKSELTTFLDGTNSKISTCGIVLGDGDQKFDHHTEIKHIAPHTKSELNFRVVLKDKARSAYTGNLKITHEAVKSNAYQENRNLLLSDNAKAESIPELEILTNDVTRCSHGVTVGKIDMSQIFYLMSRGLNFEEAERLIVKGFLEPTLSKIPESSPSIIGDAVMRINQKLGDTSDSEYEY